jgi:hypothetical protein
MIPKQLMQFGPKYGAGDVAAVKDDSSLWGGRDIDYGYLFFLGTGRDSRRSEIGLALCDMRSCRSSGLGKQFAEVPFATVRAESFDVLKAIEESTKGSLTSGPEPNKIISDRLVIIVILYCFYCFA